MSDPQALLATLQQAGVAPFSDLELIDSFSTRLSLDVGTSRLFAVRQEAAPFESQLGVSLCVDEVSSVAGEFPACCVFVYFSGSNKY